MLMNRRLWTQLFGAAVAYPVAAALADDETPSKPLKPVKIGQIGVGHAHASKLSVYRESPAYEVVGVAEPDPQLRKRAEGNGPYRDLPFMTVEQLLNTEGLEAVLIETRVRDLLKYAAMGIDADLHVHLDKPAGESLDDYRRLLKRAEAKGKLVQMGYMYRYNPAVVMLREFLQRGWLGDPFEVHTVMSKVVGADTRRQLGEYPGGIMFELGCHIMDLAVGMLGRPAEVHGYQRHSSPLSDPLVDNMLAVLTYPKAIATVKSSAQEVEGFTRRHFVLCGTEGTFHIQPLDNPSARIALARPRGDQPKGLSEVKFPRYRRYVGDAIDMARIIREQKTSDFSYSHDLAVQETLLKACE